MVRVHQHVVSLAVADQCVVATDDAEVLDVCGRFGIPVVLTDANHPSGTDRVAEVAALVAYQAFDVILNVQGDEPFVSEQALRGAVAIVRDGVAPIGTVAVPASSEILARSDVVKVVRADDGRALYFSRAPIPFLRESAESAIRDGVIRQHVGVYAYTRTALAQWVAWPPHPLERIERLEQLRPLAHGLAIGVADASAAEAGIDTEEDLIRANHFWSQQQHSSDAPVAAVPLPHSPTTSSLGNA